MSKTSKKTNKSMSALAAGLGISRSTLYLWRDGGAPIDRGEGAILEWAMAENKRGNDTDEMRSAKLGVLRETERRLKIANDDKSKDILKRADVEKDTCDFMCMLWQTLDCAFGYELPPQLIGITDPGEIATRLGVQLQKFKEILRLELRKYNGGQVLDREYTAVQISAEAIAVLHVCSKRAWDEKVINRWEAFVRAMEKEDAEQRARRRAWCIEAAAQGRPVPDATSQEMEDHPGLRRA